MLIQAGLIDQKQSELLSGVETIQEISGLAAKQFGISEEDITKQKAAFFALPYIDVVGKKGNQYTIIEIKREATSKALGEIQLYFHCFLRDWKSEAPVKTMILTDIEMPEMKQICELDDTQLIIV